MNKIVAKVAQIISQSELAFNAGSEQGVDVGNIATVQKPVAIRDPDSQEELGTVMVPTLRLRIHLVEPKFSVGAVIDQQDTDNGMSNIFTRTRPRYKRIVESAGEVKPRVNVLVHIGDGVSIEISEAE